VCRVKRPHRGTGGRRTVAKSERKEIEIETWISFSDVVSPLVVPSVVSTRNVCWWEGLRGRDCELTGWTGREGSSGRAHRIELEDHTLTTTVSVERKKKRKLERSPLKLKSKIPGTSRWMKTTDENDSGHIFLALPAPAK